MHQTSELNIAGGGFTDYERGNCTQLAWFDRYTGAKTSVCDRQKNHIERLPLQQRFSIFSLKTVKFKDKKCIFFTNPKTKYMFSKFYTILSIIN